MSPLVDKSLPMFIAEEWKIAAQVCDVLESFKQVKQWSAAKTTPEIYYYSNDNRSFRYTYEAIQTTALSSCYGNDFGSVFKTDFKIQSSVSH